MTKEIITELQNAVFPKISHKETIAMTDSLKVVYYFGKKHKNIIQSINTLGCSLEFS